jgi:hypothetical protein
MRSPLRTVAACLLMLLLPLQGFAAAAGLRAMNQCPMAMSMAHDDCQHAMQAASLDNAHDHAQGDAAKHSGRAQDKNTCDMGMNCPAFAAPGMVSAGPLFFTDPGAATLHAAIEPHYTSHVPEGLQRPPRQLA